ncbi:MAG: hypothetical protein IJL14_05340, partial [Selenomonadaceae bacterium]|nr:hypothetical protein [Selenomonadaceae bacterium]
IETSFLCDVKLPFFACPKKISKRKDTSQGRLLLIAPTLRLTVTVRAANDASCVVVAAAVILDGL